MVAHDYSAGPRTANRRADGVTSARVREHCRAARELLHALGPPTGSTWRIAALEQALEALEIDPRA